MDLRQLQKTRNEHQKDEIEAKPVSNTRFAALLAEPDTVTGTHCVEIAKSDPFVGKVKVTNQPGAGENDEFEPL